MTMLDSIILIYATKSFLKVSHSPCPRPQEARSSGGWKDVSALASIQSNLHSNFKSSLWGKERQNTTFSHACPSRVRVYKSQKDTNRSPSPSLAKSLFSSSSAVSLEKLSSSKGFHADSEALETFCWEVRGEPDGVVVADLGRFPPPRNEKSWKRVNLLSLYFEIKLLSESNHYFPQWFSKRAFHGNCTVSTDTFITVWNKCHPFLHNPLSPTTSLISCLDFRSHLQVLSIQNPKATRC